MTHDGVSFVIGAEKSVQEGVRSEEEEHATVCPNNIKQWTELTSTGFLPNKYITV